MNDARQLYVTFFGFLKAQLGSGKFANLKQRKFTVLGVLWPSKKFADQDLIPGSATGDAGGAAGVVSTADVAQDDLLQRLDLFKDALGDPAAAPQFAEARSLVPELANFPSKQRRFVDLIRSVLPQTSEAVTVEDASPAFFKLDAQDLINRLSRPMPLALAQTSGNAAGLNTGRGSAAGLGDVLSGIKGSFTHLLNYTTYYVMKDRAGTVGRTGVYRVLREVRGLCGWMEVHVAGHPFGAPVVTPATDGLTGTPSIKTDSITLFQGVFSHFCFAFLYNKIKAGFFRAVVTSKK